MSSKFGGIPKTQKPPAVCKAPPPLPFQVPPPFNERTFQGYCEWYDSLDSDQPRVTGTVTMLPDPPTNTWEGRTPHADYVLELEMEWDPVADTFDYTIQLIKFGTPAGQYQLVNQIARSRDPFDSGLMDYIGTGGQKLIFSRIML